MKARSVWWVAPAGALMLTSVPTLIVATTASPGQFRQLWGATKVLRAQDAVLIAIGMGTFILAASLSALGRARELTSPWPALSPARRRVLVRSVTPLFALTFTGYLAFGLSAYRNGLSVGTVLSALRGQNVEGLAGALGQITGVTSLTQVGVAFVVVAALVMTGPHRTRVRWQLGIVLVLTLVRADLLAERLALLELAIPLASVLVLRLASSRGPGVRKALLATPVVLVPLVFVGFGAFEYARSWQFYKTRTTIGFPQFVVDRLAGYYATAYNNGVLLLDNVPRSGRVPFDSLQAIWTAPGNQLYGGYPAGHSGDPVAQYTHLLTLFGNPEYNSQGGWLTPFVDWGHVGGVLFLAVLGVGIGVTHRHCLEARGWAVLFYPTLTTGLFELPRYIYWTEGRFVPAVVSLGVIAWIAHRAEVADAPDDIEPGGATEPVEAPVPIGVRS